MHLRPIFFFLLLLATAPAPAHDPARWVGTWASSQQIPEDRNALPPADLDDATLRQIVHTTIGGETLRIRLSNMFGTEPLTVRSIHVARSSDPATARIDPTTDRTVTFAGLETINIPAGADYVSDPVTLAVPAMSHLAISFHLPDAPVRQTSHPGSRATIWYLRGDQAAAADLPGARSIAHWYQLAGVDVVAPAGAAAIVVLGDSITDGYGVQPNTDTRWPDFLARRLQADP